MHQPAYIFSVIFIAAHMNLTCSDILHHSIASPFYPFLLNVCYDLLIISSNVSIQVQPGAIHGKSLLLPHFLPITEKNPCVSYNSHASWMWEG
jgi:hypothetical protein